MIKKTIGGDRLGAGKKMQTALHDYGRSTHDLSENFISTAAPGMLIPFYQNIGLNGDKFKIDLNAAVRTLPTTAPLFGSFKLQLDIFQIPIRLYQGLLHNNPTKIGLEMSKVLLPKVLLRGYKDTTMYNTTKEQHAYNSLVRYLGISGVGKNNNPTGILRKFNALGILAYYDIFKNYYANKQEENAYVISPKTTKTRLPLLHSDIYSLKQLILQGGRKLDSQYSNEIQIDHTINADGQLMYITLYSDRPITYDSVRKTQLVTNESGLTNNIFNGYVTIEKLRELNLIRTWETGRQKFLNPTSDGKTIEELGYYYIKFEFIYSLEANALGLQFIEGNSLYIKTITYQKPINEIEIKPFPLENIDKMRKEILQHSELGEECVIGKDSDYSAKTANIGQYLPYSTITNVDDDIPYNQFSCNGLVLKTYQSDIFNNYLNNEWIDGENGITEISAVDVSDGKLTMDALNLAQKVYNMLNRIAIAGGTYDDWQEAVYGTEAIRKAETPIYVGGMSSEIVFEEIVSSAETEINDDTKALGSLAGKGTLLGRKGGTIQIKLNEPSIIMGIMSITPRISYSQGNMWYNTELISINDLHKPAYDGIGYQDLIGEQLHWALGSKKIAIGKLPAWQNYMTSFNKVYGEFADMEKAGFMVLNRNYEIDEENGLIKDATTYIDPTKYNYPFAYDKLDAQNFWVQIAMNITARRIMSAKQIPNL